MPTVDGSVTHILWQAASAPGGAGSTEGTCRVCGRSGIGLIFADWVRPTFTDWDKLVPGDILCQPCQFAFEERSELLAERVGKDKPQRMRNYSHFVIDGEWLPLSKGDKVRMAQILTTQEPEVAIIAVSGQKHLIFRAQPGWWQIEEESVLPFPAKLSYVLQIVEELYSTFSKTEIRTADYRHDRVLRFGLKEWHTLEQTLAIERDSITFTLALFLAQKKKGVKHGRNRGAERVTQKGSGAAVGDVAGHPVQLQIPL